MEAIVNQQIQEKHAAWDSLAAKLVEDYKGGQTPESGAAVAALCAALDAGSDFVHLEAAEVYRRKVRTAMQSHEFIKTNGKKLLKAASDAEAAYLTTQREVNQQIEQLRGKLVQAERALKAARADATKLRKAEELVTHAAENNIIRRALKGLGVVK